MRNELYSLRKELGERIRILRRSGGLTQEELGEKSGLSYKFIGEIERGQVNISLHSLAKIANALGVKIDDLFFKEKVSVQKVFLKEKTSLPKFSPRDIQVIKKALKLLNSFFKDLNFKS